MIQVNNIVTEAGAKEDYPKRIAAKLGCRLEEVADWRILKRSVDARRGAVRIVCNVAVSLGEVEERAVLSRALPDVTPYEEPVLRYPRGKWSRASRPVVAGTGPAGLFAGLALARGGARPVLLERGLPVEQRVAAVQRFWKSGDLLSESNVQFGEGGAGTFSDGKLTTGIKDARCRLVLSEFVRFGAPEEILYEARPHIGTDKLVGIVKAMREEIIRLGGEVRFSTKLAGLVPGKDGLSAVLLDTPLGADSLDTDALVLAIGHSARDTFSMLYEAGITLAQKEFSLGVRIEHLQEKLNETQYGRRWRELSLPAADYKLAVHLPGGRSVYTFCMCPGGKVVNASSEPGGVAVNGMSEYARDGVNGNSALLVNVTKDDFASAHPLAGVEFQRKYERAAYRLTDSYRPPCQRVADFLAGKATSRWGEVLPSAAPDPVRANLAEVLPRFAAAAIRQALPLLDRKLAGFACGDAVLTGVEARSSSPVRILRDEQMQASLRGVYPAGEGAGYAGGIMSAAVDGLRAAEAVLQSRQN